jgi:hypothetical protein
MFISFRKSHVIGQKALFWRVVLFEKISKFQNLNNTNARADSS